VVAECRLFIAGTGYACVDRLQPIFMLRTATMLERVPSAASQARILRKKSRDLLASLTRSGAASSSASHV